MKVLVAVLAFVVMGQAHAQTQTSGETGGELAAQSSETKSAAQPAAPKKQKRTVIYDESTNEIVEIQPEVAEATSQPAGLAPIYILNNRIQGAAPQVQEQPAAIVQDTPLKASAAEGMRRKRQDEEVATEDGIVQALEKARIEDELRRRDRFSNAISPATEEAKTQAAPQPAQQPEPTPVAQPAPAPVPVVQQVVPVYVQDVVAEEEPKPRKRPVTDDEETSAVRSEIRASFEATKPQTEAKQSVYVTGLVGMGTYDNVVNVRGDLAGGFAVGVITPERLIAEGSFLAGDYLLEDVYNSWDPINGIYYPRMVDMRQYNVGGALKYQILPGKLQPTVGALASYTRRNFSERGYDFKTSDSVDLGLQAGVDLALTENFSLGFDFRYFTNLVYREVTDYSAYPQSFVYDRQRNEIEKLDYYMTMLTGKLTF
jgi:opacity protein-like surface antigen